MTDTEVFMSGEGDAFTLSDIASLNTTDIEEQRFEVLPIGIYQMRCVEAKLMVKPTKNGPSPCIEMQHEIVDLTLPGAWKDKQGNEKDPNTLKGKKFTENFYLDKKDVVKSIGFVKAYMKDSGFTGEGELQEMLALYVGTEFRTPITHRKDPNDTDKVYPQTVQDKFAPVKKQATPAPSETVAA